MIDFVDYLVALALTIVVVAALAGLVFLCAFLWHINIVLSIAVGFVLFNAILIGSMAFMEWYA